jgi:hypothetical protein
MHAAIKPTLAVLAATLWISVSEFFRNEFLLKSYWLDHFQSLGISFPSDPINGAMWGVWSLLCAIAIYFIAQKFSLVRATALAWFTVFVLMWVSSGNMGILPFGLLPLAIPLSLLEVFVAVWLINRLS